jgi:hypothetical protein
MGPLAAVFRRSGTTLGERLAQRSASGWHRRGDRTRLGDRLAQRSATVWHRLGDRRITLR